MEVIRPLKNILYGKNNIIINVSLFSIIGIFSLALCCIISTYIPTNYLGYPPKEYYELSIAFFSVFIISIYLLGYIYDYANAKFYNKEDIKLIDLTMNSFNVFAKMFPIFLIWGTYYSFAAVLGLILFKIGTIGIIIYYCLITCLIPYTFIIFTLYAQDFKLTKELISPLYLLKIIWKTFFNVTFFAIKTIPLYIIICFSVIKLVSVSTHISNPNILLGIRILGFITLIYINFLYNLLFIDSSTELIKKKNLAYDG